MKGRTTLTSTLRFVIHLLLAVRLHAAESFDPLAPYTAPSIHGVDTSTLTGKVMAGYQGWFNCEGDGAGLGWTHWAEKREQLFAPGNVKVDLWPDVSECGPDELFPTGFQLADGKPAPVFSSYRRETVLRHFRWMREYGIDGVFVQRFANGLKNPAQRHHKNVVLANCREGANREGRAYAVMYDLSGLPAGGVSQVIDDWRILRTKMKIGDDAAYLRHDGKPLVAVWGIGFGDGRKYMLAECRTLIEYRISQSRWLLCHARHSYRLARAQSRCRARSHTARGVKTRRRPQPLDTRSLSQSGGSHPSRRETLEARYSLVPRAFTRLHAGGFPWIQLAQHGAGIPARTNPQTERRVPLVAVCCRQNRRCPHDLRRHVRRGR